MGVLKVVLGLVMDDVRLVGVLGLFLVAAYVLHVAGRPLLAALAIWAGLVAALVISVSHQLRLKLRP